MSITVIEMGAGDLPDVLAIQARCYDAAKHESAAVFQAKLDAAPGCSFVARRGATTLGYLVAVPALMGLPPPLHGEDCPLPPAPDCLYLHDMAVAPEARGSGSARALVAAFLAQQRRLGFAHAALTAVNGASGYWERLGFTARDAVGLDSYGDGAVYMTRQE
ncbi:GNAT family N-acetyltransferase [Pelomonas sp. KK5]|uniref:GNAT family N-acetyltransferase n=1 Tax=Pelomonas sp. KK5 TaxID=1855730 RepID=UPI0009F9CFAF|nr:GNAT family N-acetyltransferase [Pelomonas sp. KK5]